MSDEKSRPPQGPTVAPTWSGIDTFWRAPQISPDEVEAGVVAFVGAPHDMTVSTRQGVRYGPKAVREHSNHFMGQIRAAPTSTIVDVRSGDRLTIPDELPVVDCADMLILPNDLEATTNSIRETMQLLVRRGAFPIVVGGDHYITYPLFDGVGRALREASQSQSKIGHLHIDAHTDACDDQKLWGKYWHGSCTRRISELPFTSVKNMAWLGLNSFTWEDDWTFIQDNSLKIVTTATIRDIGMKAAAQEAIDAATDGIDAVYVSLDIDVVDISLAPGTGSTNFGGITYDELFDAMAVISQCEKVVALDVCEVAPPLDPTGRTPRLAASALWTFLAPRLFVTE